jgi:tetratricopeptide (TPR) repeat protein
MGNNEVVGPYGPGTVFTPVMSWLPLIRLNMWQRSTRTGQWIGSLLTRRQPQAEWRGMEMFQERLVPQDDPHLAAMYRNFRRNLEDIVEVGRRAGVPVLISTVAVNLKDSPPFAGKAAAEQFRMGQRCFASGDTSEAGEAFARARDLDALRFRADSRINGIIREVAARSGATLADVERAFGPAPGSDLFYEHVHLRFAGNYLVARMLAELIKLRFPAAGDFPDAKRAAALLPYTPWDEHRMASQMHAMMERPPFTNQPGYQAARQERLPLLKTAGNVTDALAAYRGAMELRPGDLHLQLRYAELLPEAGRPAEAERVWRGLLLQASTMKEWHAGLASVLADEGRVDEAVAEYRQALELDPDFDVAQFGCGVALAQQRRYAEAADHYREALRINPAYAEAYNNLGLALGEPRKAEECYRQALRLRPEYTEARNNLALALSVQGRLDEAVAELREAIHRDPDFAGTHYNLAGTLARLGHAQEAASEYGQALKLKPDYADASAGLGAVLFQSGNLAGALEAYGNAVQARPQSAEMRYNYGLILSRAGKLEAAIEQYREALRLDAGSADVHNNLGVALARQHRFQEAAGHFQKAVEIRPDFSAARLNLDRALRGAEGR